MEHPPVSRAQLLPQEVPRLPMVPCAKVGTAVGAGFGLQTSVWMHQSQQHAAQTPFRYCPGEHSYIELSLEGQRLFSTHRQQPSGHPGLSTETDTGRHSHDPQHDQDHKELPVAAKGYVSVSKDRSDTRKAPQRH